MRPAGIYKSHDLMTCINSPLTSDFGQIIKFKIFVQGRILRPINGSKLIFHIRPVTTQESLPAIALFLYEAF